MIQSLLYLFFAFFVSVCLVPFVIVIASRYRWFDQPEARKVHRVPIPRLGGVAIFIAVWTTWAVFCVRHPNSIPYESVAPLKAIFVSTTLIWLLGIYDDLKGANAWQKLAVQIPAAMWVIANGIDIHLMHNPVGSDFILNSPFVIWALSLLWIIVVTNSINLIDGLDGLAAGVCFITSLSLCFIARELGSPHLPFLALSIAGACLGFLVYNFSPARIFLGDSGSLSLGFLLATLSILGSAKRSTAIVMFGPPVILALPVVDALLAVARRFFRRDDRAFPRRQNFWQPSFVLLRLKDIFRADQEHIHHGLLKIGLSHRKAVIILYIVTLILGVTAYGNAVKDHLAGTLVIFAALSLALVWLRRKVRRTKLEAGE